MSLIKIVLALWCHDQTTVFISCVWNNKEIAKKRYYSWEQDYGYLDVI